jgi:hypothetical protein
MEKPVDKPEGLSDSKGEATVKPTESATFKNASVATQSATEVPDPDEDDLDDLDGETDHELVVQSITDS